MKKIQKQLEKEKLRVEERKREKAVAKAKRKIEREEAAKNGRKLLKMIQDPVRVTDSDFTKRVPNCEQTFVKIKFGALAF